jgi:hypothetical protein
VSTTTDDRKSSCTALLPQLLADRERAQEEEILARIFAGEDSAELIKGALGLCGLFSHHSREIGILAGCICADPRVQPGIRGAVLRRVWTSGKMQSPLAIFPRRDVLSWFNSASPLTLMNDDERAHLASLANFVEAWRGGRGSTLRQAAQALSWTFDRQRARWFADRWRPRYPALIVGALFPRDAVVAYFAENGEREVVVNWRRARNLVACA